jgi:hypothetical protein
VTAGDVWRRFGRWRRRRPFWGSLFLLLAGAELFYTANASIAGLSLHLGPTGFLSYLLPLMLIVCALLCIFSPAQRLFYGIVALLTALYSFIGLNLGGFFIGMLLGIIGGALVIAWGPPRVRPVNPDFVPIADQVALEEEASDTTEIKSPSSAGTPAPGSDDETQHSEDEAQHSGAETRHLDDETEHVEVAGHDDRPTEDVRPATDPEQGIVPGFDDDQEGPKSGSRRSRLSRNPKALTAALIVMGLTAAMLAVGSRVPASAAADCPKGLPSRSAAATPSDESAAAGKAAARSGSSKSGSKTGTKTGSKSDSKSGSSDAGSAKQEATATPTPAPSKDKDGNPIVDGVKGLVGGLGNLLGLGDDDPSTAPSTSPETPETPATPDPTKTGNPEPPATGEPTKGSTEPAPGAPAVTTPAAAASGSDDDKIIPCLGARVLGLEADGNGIPRIAAKPGLLETNSLQMFESTYDGVVNLPTGGGTSARVLKFSMKRAVNKPFSLTIDEADGAHTVITSDKLTTAGNVKFFTQRFEGRLFGVIPVVFTPDSPPPLTLAYLWFTHVKIQLNYVQCDVLTGFPLHISEK